MRSKRALIFIMLLPLLGMLLSCDVFLAPKQGRWNPNDPNAELEPLSQHLAPTVDGFLGSGVPWNDAGTELKVRNDICTLLKITIPEIPDIITLAELQLCCSGGPPPKDSNVSVHRILKPWDAGTVGWTTVTAAGFFDPNPVAVTYVSAIDVLYSWDMKDAVSSLPYGILFFGDDADEKRFASIEATGDPKPTLIIEGYNKL